MDNRDIFDFDFVDRTREKIILNKFMNNEYKENFLWIDGYSGIGKSFFIKNIVLTSHRASCVYIDLSSENQSEKCLITILKEIQSHARYHSIIDFIKLQYTSVLDISKNLATSLAKIKGLNIDWFFELVFDSSKVFVDHHNQRTSSIRLLEKYFDFLLSTSSILLIVDNFSYSDKMSIDVLQQLLFKYIFNKKLQCIFVTTQEVIEKKEYIQIFLTEKLPIKYLKMKPLDDAKYFYSILDPIFELDNNIVDDIRAIFDICLGKPEDLKSFIRKLYLSDAIHIPDNELERARINSELMKKQIVKRSIELEKNDFSSSQRFVLLIILGFCGRVEISFLHETILYVHRQLFKGDLWTDADINDILYRLEFLKIIDFTDEVSYSKNYVKLSHDKVYYSLLAMLRNDVNRIQISYYLYSFLKSIAKEKCDCDASIDYLIAFHAHISHAVGWAKVNFEYGEYLCSCHQYLDASKIFLRLNEVLNTFNDVQKLAISKCYYEAGEYDNAKSILENIRIDDKDNSFCFEYHYYIGKTENVLLNKKGAIEHYNLAYNCARSRSDEILMRHLMHLSLLETPTGKEAAKKIFDDIALHLTPEEKNMLPVCYLLRNCNQFYTGKQAISFFQLAIDIANRHQSDVDVAYVYNNMGLELFRTGNRDEANERFVSAYEILSEHKIHESAYPLNNMAVYMMFKNDYIAALNYLLDAKYLSQSIYASLAIKVHMMICYRELGKEKNCRKLMSELSDYLKNKQINDTNIIRKLSINLCVTHKFYNEKIDAKEYIQIAKPYIRGTISEYRGVNIFNELFDKNETCEEALQSNPYYTKLDFEPWVITLSHD